MFKSSFTQLSCRTAVALALVASSTQVMAHGYLESPKARQAICHEQGAIGGLQMVHESPTPPVALRS